MSFWDRALILCLTIQLRTAIAYSPMIYFGDLFSVEQRLAILAFAMTASVAMEIRSGLGEKHGSER